MSFCPQAPASLHVFQAYEPFERIPAISLVHNVAPRFGHTANITKLILGSSEEGEDYFRGLVAGSLAVVILFIVWVVVLIVVKCLGPKRVGWISGSRNPLPPIQPILEEYPAHKKDNDFRLQQEESGETAVDKGTLASDDRLTEIRNQRFLRLKTQDKRMKGCIIISAGVIVVCSLLMLSLGVPGLNDIFNGGRASLSLAIDLSGQAIEVSNEGEGLLNSTVKDLDELSDTFNAACPNIRQDLCSDPQDLTTCSTSAVYLNDVTKDYDDALRSIQSVRSELERINGQLQIAYDTLDDIAWLRSLSTFFSVLLACLCTALICSICFTYPVNGVCWARLKRVARCLFIPILVVSVFFALSLAIAAIVVSTGMSDACADSPKEEVKKVLIKESQSMDGLSAEVAQYFIDGCRRVPTLDILKNLPHGSNVLGAFATELQNATQLAVLEEVCGTISAGRWIQQSNAVSVTMCGGSIRASELVSIFECSEWYGVYESVAHDVVCYHVDELSLIAFTQFCVVCCAFIIATCRVAIYQGIEISPEESTQLSDDDKSKNSRDEAAPISLDEATTNISHDETSRICQEETTFIGHDEIYQPMDQGEIYQINPEEPTQSIRDEATMIGRKESARKKKRRKEKIRRSHSSDQKIGYP